ncbi:MAG: diaminobutyrate acetyltransferase [Paracoccaceae bacterium]|nr:diaminobutyrate acetyltransferase [Paracoccaceae bacterium]
MNKGDHFDIQQPGGAVRIREPQAGDGPRIWHLIEATGALDSNSLYCNLLQCSHFAATCALAEMDDQLVGWMSGYVPPARPDTLFVWQVCVTDAARGQGVASRLISSVLKRPGCRDVRHVECTITTENAASWALFRKVACELEADLISHPHFLRETHLDGRHDREHRVTIGPFEASGLRQAKAA